MSGKSLFFAGSDDDDDNAKMGPRNLDDDVQCLLHAAGSQIASQKAAFPSENEGLFFASSDDEDLGSTTL